MDIGMLREDYERFVSLAKDELSLRFILSTWEDGTDYSLPFAKVQLKNTVMEEPATSALNLCHGIWVDIFPYDTLPYKVPFYRHYRFKLKMCYLLNLLQKGYHLESTYQCSFLHKVLYKLLRLIAKITKHINYKDVCKNLILKYKNIDERRCETSGLLSENFIFPSKYFQELIPFSFENETFLGPSNYDEYLTHAYGNYKQLPPVEDRVAWHGVKKIQFEDETILRT